MSGNVEAPRSRPGRVPILMYHAVSPVPDPRFSKYTVTPAAFLAQIRWLARAGFHTITPDDLVAARTRGAALPPRPVMITFDDGFRDTAHDAPPILAAHGFRAVFYLVTGLAAATSRWMVPEVGVELPLIGWDEARTLETDGFICGSHSVTHPRLARVPLDDCRRELHDSRRSLEDALGRAVTDLAYPFGSHDDHVVEAAQEAGYLTAVTTEEGFSTDEPMLRLRRLPVEGRDSLLDFRFRVLTGRTPGGWWQLARERLSLRHER